MHGQELYVLLLALDTRNILQHIVLKFRTNTVRILLYLLFHFVADTINVQYMCAVCIMLDFSVTKRHDLYKPDGVRFSASVVKSLLSQEEYFFLKWFLLFSKVATHTKNFLFHFLFILKTNSFSNTFPYMAKKLSDPFLFFTTLYP